MPSRISSGPSGRFSGLAERGMVAWKAFEVRGVMIMKMIRSTSITSISGVTLMSALTAARALVADRATGRLRLLRLELLREDRAAELRPNALDQGVDQLLRGVGHLHREEVDLGGGGGGQPHRPDRDARAGRGRA